MSQHQIKRALISVSNKEGLIPLCKALVAKGVEILSTGNTAKILEAEHIAVKKVSDHTGSKEILDGRVKTLHPKIHGGLLARRNLESHQKQVQEEQIDYIDLVVVNLYPFTQTVAQSNCTLEQAIENIDIGGPSMIRSAAKNWESVAVLVDPKDYPAFIKEFDNQDASLSANTRFNLAKKAFFHTAAYDGAISEYLSKVEASSIEKSEQSPELREFPTYLSLHAELVQALRYGENPHQKAAFYKFQKCNEINIADAQILHGKELSYNNIVDLESALNIVKEFKQPAVAIVKHNNPCGVALANNLAEAFIQARSCDPVSAFGGIVALNLTVDEDCARLLSETFFECIVAPNYSNEALEILKQKKNIRLLKTQAADKDASQEKFELKSIAGALLLQEKDKLGQNLSAAKVVSNRQPNDQEMRDLSIAWLIAKHVKSNAIVLCKNGKSVGIGAGQMSRVDSVRVSAFKALSSGQDIQNGCVLASDAFFPFADGIEEAAKIGVTAIIQPGGSVRDPEVILAANQLQIAMLFTNERHFRH